MVTLRSQRDTEKTVPPDQAGFEFYRFMSHGISWEKLVLPDKFRSDLSGRELQEVKLRVAGGGGRRVWDVEVDVNEYGDMCLSRGWREFAGANGLELGQLLVFRYDSAALLTVTVFEDSECRRPYQDAYEEREQDDGAERSPLPPAPAPRGRGRSSSSGMAEACTDPASSQFSVMLRKCHLGKKQNQYLSVPMWFHEGHGYTERSKVVALQMRGESWTVRLKHYKLGSGSTRTAFRYGWRQFCVDNGLGLGDTCFFQALPEGTAALRVEVRKQDGTVIQ